MISEGSCDSEDWSNDTLITAINYILTYIHIENTYLNCNNISQYYCFYCDFDQISAAFVGRREFQKHLENTTDQRCLHGSVWNGT